MEIRVSIKRIFDYDQMQFKESMPNKFSIWRKSVNDKPGIIATFLDTGDVSHEYHHSINFLELLHTKEFTELSKLYRFIRSSLTFIEDILLQQLNIVLKGHKITLLDKVTFLLYNTIAIRLFSTKSINFDSLLDKI